MKNVLLVVAVCIVVVTGIFVWWLAFTLFSENDVVWNFFPIMLFALPAVGLFARGIIFSETLSGWHDGHPHISIWHVARDLFHLNYISLVFAGIVLLVLQVLSFLRKRQNIAVSDIFGSTKIW